ncbi:MAG: hypothetical protein WCA35_32025 [Kovacikia sp.]
MSGLINFVKGLFSGIFGFLGGILGSKKKSEAASENQSKPAKPKKSNGYFLELDDAKGIGSSSNGAAAPVAESAKQPAPVAAKAESKPAQQPAPVAVAKALNLPEPKVATFATDYLLTSGSNGRRRPGANMASYLNLARQVKTPG